MPTRPVSSSGRRPKRSTKATAMNVAATFTAPTANRVAVVCSAAVVNPARSKILSA